MAEGSLQVELLYALPERYWCERLELPVGATVAEALARSTLRSQVPGLEIDPQRIAMHGRLVTAETVLGVGDRIELLRPLLCDPKVSRRQRAQKARSGGTNRKA